jgi:hydrogenase expression/formation protein HypE
LSTLACGKLDPNLLESLLQKFRGVPDTAVLVGPGIGRDAAVLSAPAGLLVAKTDPITFATDRIGGYAVDVNANDVACMGGTPRWFLAAVLLPESTSTEQLVADILGQIDTACRRHGIALCGGHTEVTLGLDRPIVVGHMLGTVSPERMVSAAGAIPGDHLLLTKAIAIEGTRLLASELGERLHTTVSEEVLDRCLGLLDQPGISVVQDAHLALDAGGVHALHDPTEGGLATGIQELASASGTDVEVWAAAVPVLPETRTLCAALHLDPLGLIASGSLLIAAAPDSAAHIAERLGLHAIPCARIGTVLEAEQGCTLLTGDGRQPLPRFDQDEVARVLASPR